MKRFSIRIYRPSDKPGMVKYVGNESYLATREAVTIFLQAQQFPFEWVSSAKYKQPTEQMPIPAFDELIVTNVEGTNEGEQILIFGLIHAGQTYLPILTIKHFSTDGFSMAENIYKFLNA